MKVSTYENTPFLKWWKLFNAELAKLQMPESTYDVAMGCYEVGESPLTAARYLALA